MAYTRRTDLAIESQELFQSSTEDQTALSGVVAREESIDGYIVHRVEILDAQGAAALGKPQGVYFTLTTTPFTSRQEKALPQGLKILSNLITQLMGDIPQNSPILIVGLGNRAITPDGLGPRVWNHTLITRHLVDSVPEHFGDMRPVAAVAAGVLGTTGVESGELVSALVKKFSPSSVIAIDALASRSIHRLCNTIQLSNSGISPGSGVGNHRQGLNQATLGVPVLAIGVPTVIDGGTLAADLLDLEDPPQLGRELFVTPRDIDRQIQDFAKFIALGINTALHPALSLEDLELLVD